MTKFILKKPDGTVLCSGEVEGGEVTIIADATTYGFSLRGESISIGRIHDNHPVSVPCYWVH